jgi:hypothetical protein
MTSGTSVTVLRERGGIVRVVVLVHRQAQDHPESAREGRSMRSCKVECKVGVYPYMKWDQSVSPQSVSPELA